MKKKWLGISLLILICVIAAITLLTPKALCDDSKPTLVDLVYYNSEKAEESSKLENVDTEKLIEVLEAVKISKIPGNYQLTAPNDFYEIHLTSEAQEWILYLNKTGGCFAKNMKNNRQYQIKQDGLYEVVNALMD